MDAVALLPQRRGPPARAAALVLAALLVWGGARAAWASEIPPLFRGVIVPMLTPYAEADVGQVDEPALRAFTDWLCGQPVAALFPVGGLGQAELLSSAEKRAVVAAVIEAAAGRVPVIAGVGGESTAETLELARHAIARGASALGIVTPSFLRGADGALGQDALLRYYGELAVQLPTDVPILIYDARGELAPRTARALAERPNLRAIKYRQPSASALARMAMAVGERMAVLAGIENDTLAVLALGGAGVVGGGANAYPAELARIVERFQAGDGPGALRAQRRVLELGDALESSLELRYLLRELAGLPIAHTRRAGSPGALRAEHGISDAESLARLKDAFRGVIRRAAAAAAAAPPAR